MNESSASANTCPKCGAALPSAATAGLCPRCLMAEAMVPTQTDAEPAATRKTLSPAELAPHFPQLEILECLGRGGMGVVYKARQKSLNRLVALKLLAPERVADGKFAQRFTHEAQALAALNHPNIVTIHDFGQAGGFYFLLMEFVDGVNLRQAMKTGRFTPEQALAVVPPVCEALQYAHEHGIVHRDIKPENLLLDKEGRVKIADFGIAKMLGGDTTIVLSDKPQTESTESEGTLASAAGTPQYMAPEQKSAPQRVDSRADIYSLGVVIYEMLTGELPAEKLQPPSRKVQIDVRLDEIVLRALEQRPELRFQTAADLRTQVETMVSTPQGSRRDDAQTSSTPPRFLKIGTSTLTTPEQLATAEGQVFCYRTRGQLILDDRQLTHSHTGTNTVIPLAAIRDLSIGQYPRSMNPAGVDLLSVTYEEGGQRKQVLLSPMEGFIGLPATFNARVAEWFMAIREATTAATGRAPGNTPAERLGVPGSSPLLLAVACVPLFVSAGLLWMLMRGSGSTNGFARGAFLLIFVALVVGFLAPALFGWLSSLRRTASPGDSSFGKFPAFLVVFVLLLLVLGFGILQFFAHVRSPGGVTSFDSVPVGVSNNVVIVDVTTEVGRGNAELRAILDGPQLPAATEAVLADVFFPPFAGTFIKPTPHAGNHPWRILSPGRQTWRLGFVLPDAALAKDAIESLRPVGPLPAVPDRTFAGTLFEVRQTNGQVFRASLQVALPFTSADPDWVSVFGHSQHNESAVTLNWEVLASGHGLAHFSRAGTPIITLQSNPQTKLYGASIQLELTKAGTNLVQLVRRIRGETIREELPGDFRELADELLRTATFSAKATSGTKIELCQFQGKPFVVQVHVTDSPGTYQLKVGAAVGVGAVGLLLLVAVIWYALRKKQPGASPGSNVGAVLAGCFALFVLFIGAALLLFWVSRSDGPAGIPTPIWAIGTVILPIAAGGIVLLLVLVRKGRSASKGVMLLVGVPLLCVAVFIAVWVLSQARSPVSATELDEAGLAADALPAIPQHIEFKALRVENPPGSRDILLHFERDTNYGLALEVSQDVTPSPTGRKLPVEGYRTWQHTTWVGLGGGRALHWVLPAEFTESEARAVAKDVEKRAKELRQLSDGAMPEFATATHRDGWKYHLVARVKRELGSPHPPLPVEAKLLGQFRVIAPAGGVMQVSLSSKQNDRPDASPDTLTFKLAADRPGKLLFRWHAYSVERTPGGQWFVDVVDENTGLIFHRFEGGFGQPMKVVSPRFSPNDDSTVQFQLDAQLHNGLKLFHAEEIIALGQPLTSWQDTELGILFSPHGASGITPQFQLPPADSK